VTGYAARRRGPGTEPSFSLAVAARQACDPMATIEARVARRGACRAGSTAHVRSVALHGLFVVDENYQVTRRRHVEDDSTARPSKAHGVLPRLGEGRPAVVGMARAAWSTR
jgi:hypothetical protein